MADKVITGPKTRWSYVNVLEPKSINGSEPKYSISLLIPKDDVETVNKIKQAIQAAYAAGKDRLSNGKNVPPLSALRTPLRDGDTDPNHAGDPVYANHYFLNANSKTRPGIVDSALNPIMSADDIYSGCYGRASISFYAYNASGNKGIACGINNLMKCEDGERLGGHASAEDDFKGYGTLGGSLDNDFMS